MKRCSKCKEEKPRSEFHKDRSRKDGLYPKCKTCAREEHKKYHAKHREEQNIKRQERYEKNIEKERETRRQYHRDNLKARHAKAKIKYALKTGTLQRPDPPICENCGEETENIEGHHEDYDRPLDVKWLCKECHSVIHDI